MRKNKKESGMVIVEATIVFPVMFLVILLMLIAGNAFLQKCRVDSIINRLAIEGAAYCIDPHLSGVEAGNLPELDNLGVYPYRFIWPDVEQNAGNVESDIQNKAKDRITNLGTGYFNGMKPENATVNTKYNYGFLSSSFSIETEYKIVLPIRLLWEDENIKVAFASRTEMPVADPPDFIRNVDMVQDYIEKTGLQEKIDEAVEKINKAIDTVKSWFNK